MEAVIGTSIYQRVMNGNGPQYGRNKTLQARNGEEVDAYTNRGATYFRLSRSKQEE